MPNVLLSERARIARDRAPRPLRRSIDRVINALSSGHSVGANEARPMNRDPSTWVVRLEGSKRLLFRRGEVGGRIDVIDIVDRSDYVR